MVVRDEKLVYILGKNIVTQSLTHVNNNKVISRQAKLVSLDLSHDAKKLAVGDDFGKIYILYNFMHGSQAKIVIQSLPQWHAHSVNALKFTESDFLLSAGKESVLVQWNLEKQDKTFISRLGRGEIITLGLSTSEYYSCLFSDNCFKVLRFDNNKAVISSNNLQFASNFSMHLRNSDQVAIVHNSQIYFKNLQDANPNVSSTLDTNPRNYSSTDFSGNSYKIESSTFSPDQTHLVTYETLIDAKFENKNINLSVLKMWTKEESGYALKQLVHSPAERKGAIGIVMFLNN